MILVNKSLHSRACSSSHVNNIRLHRQTSPSSLHPRAYISATIAILLMDKSKRQLKVFFSTTPSIQGSHQKRVVLPSPTTLPMLSSINLPNPTPIPRVIVIKLFHQTELNLPPSTILSPTSPYLATRTLYHKLLLSIFILQHHLSSKTKLNSLDLQTPEPPFSFLEHIVSHLRFNRRNDTCGSLEEGNKVDRLREQDRLQKY